MRILHAISSGGLFGAERVILNLIDAMQDASFAVALYEKPDGGHAPFAAELDRRGITMHLLNDSIGSFRKGVRRLNEIIERDDFSVLHAHGYKANVAAVSALSEQSHCRLICTEHGFTDKSLKSRIYGALDRLALRAPAVDEVVCVSSEIAARCRKAGVAQSKIVYIPNCVPQSKSDGKPGFEERDIDILFLGRLSMEKGADILVDALSQVKQRPARVVLAGDGECRATLEQKIGKAGLSSVVDLPGFQPDPSTLLARARWLAVPSRTEGMPLAFLEALGAGVPVVATRVGDIAALDAKDGWGVLVKPGSVEAYAAALEKSLAVSADEWTKRSKAAQALVRTKFDFSEWIARWRAVYRLPDVVEAAA